MVGAARALGPALAWLAATLLADPAFAEEPLVARVACREGAVNGAFELRSGDGSLRSDVRHQPTVSRAISPSGATLGGASD